MNIQGVLLRLFHPLTFPKSQKYEQTQQDFYCSILWCRYSFQLRVQRSDISVNNRKSISIQVHLNLMRLLFIHRISGEKKMMMELFCWPLKLKRNSLCMILHRMEEGKKVYHVHIVVAAAKDELCSFERKLHFFISHYLPPILLFYEFFITTHAHTSCYGEVSYAMNKILICMIFNMSRQTHMSHRKLGEKVFRFM